MYTILHISPAFSTKGGISTVVTNYLTSDLVNDYFLQIIESHTDGSKLSKIRKTLVAFAKAIWLSLFNRPDLIHVHVGDFPSPYRKFLLILPFLPKKIPMILHFHGADFVSQYRNLPLFLQKQIGSFFLLFQTVICLSENWRQEILKIEPRANVSVVHNAVPLPTKRAVVTRASGKPLNLLFMGSIGPRKGIFELLDVIEALASNGHSVRLTIGGNGSVQELLTRIQNEPLASCVHFKGWVTGKDRDEAFSKAHVFVLPSHAEGMPMSILEAMSYGLPIISTRVGGIPELVVDAENGLLIESGDKEHLARSIIWLDENEARRQEMGMKSRLVIDQNYSFSSHLQAIRATYQETLRQRP